MPEEIEEVAELPHESVKLDEWYLESDHHRKELTKFLVSDTGWTMLRVLQAKHPLRSRRINGSAEYLLGEACGYEQCLQDLLALQNPRKNPARVKVTTPPAPHAQKV